MPRRRRQRVTLVAAAGALRALPCGRWRSRRARSPPESEVRGRGSVAPAAPALRLGVGGLTLRAAEHTCAVLVGALVGGDVVRALLVALAEHGFDFGDGELVVSRPRLLFAQCADAAQHRGAVVILALVGVDLGEVDLRELG